MTSVGRRASADRIVPGPVDAVNNPPALTGPKSVSKNNRELLVGGMPWGMAIRIWNEPQKLETQHPIKSRKGDGQGNTEKALSSLHVRLFVNWSGEKSASPGLQITRSRCRVGELRAGSVWTWFPYGVGCFTANFGGACIHADENNG